MKTTLVYSQAITLTAGSVGLFGTEQVFRLNSLYDPDFTGTGHQPYGFDQLLALYNYYKVSAVDIKLTFSDPSADGMFVASMVQPSTATYGLSSQTIATVTEKAGSLVRPLNNTGAQKVVIHHKLAIPAIENISMTQFLADYTNFSSSAGMGNPTVTPWLRCANACGTASATCTLLVELAFDAEFWDRVVLAQS